MKTSRHVLAALGVALAAAAALPAAAQPASPSYAIPDDEDDAYAPPEVRDAVRRAYQRGFDRGYRKGVEDGKRMAAPPPPPPQPVPTGPIRVTRAFYGNDSRSCDATRQVGRAANGRASASFEVTNSICGDPAPGSRKSLDVTYFCGAVEKTASAYEHRTIYLSCP